jgi:hypothetical protein
MVAAPVPMSFQQPCHQHPMHPMQLPIPPLPLCQPPPLLSHPVTSSHPFPPPFQPPLPVQAPAVTVLHPHNQGATYQQHTCPIPPPALPFSNQPLAQGGPPFHTCPSHPHPSPGFTLPFAGGQVCERNRLPSPSHPQPLPAFHDNRQLPAPPPLLLPAPPLPLPCTTQLLLPPLPRSPPLPSSPPLPDSPGLPPLPASPALPDAPEQMCEGSCLPGPLITVPETSPPWDCCQPQPQPDDEVADPAGQEGKHSQQVEASYDKFIFELYEAVFAEEVFLTPTAGGPVSSADAAATAAEARAAEETAAPMEAPVGKVEAEGAAHPMPAPAKPRTSQLPDVLAPFSVLGNLKVPADAAQAMQLQVGSRLLQMVPMQAQGDDASPSPLNDLNNPATFSPTWSPPGTPSPVLPSTTRQPSRQPSWDGHACLPVNHSLSPPCQQASELQGGFHQQQQTGECSVSGIKQEPEQQAWVPCQMGTQGPQPQQTACAGHKKDVAGQHPKAISDVEMTCPAGLQQPQQRKVLMQKADASAQQQAKVTAPTAQHHQSTHEPWVGLSCCQLWSACAYAVQGVVQQVCGGTPPSPGGLDACLAAVQLHGFLVRLAAGWWADPGAALEWLAAGFTQLSTAVPAVGRVLQAARNSGRKELKPSATNAPPAHDAKYDSAHHLSPSQLQSCLHRLSGTLQQAGASEQEIGHLLSSVQGQLDTERACASRCSAAGTRQGIMSEKTGRGAISRGSNHSLDGIPVTTAGCAGHTLLCKPCLSGRCHQQLVIATAGAEGLGLLGVEYQCLVAWVGMAMGTSAAAS